MSDLIRREDVIDELMALRDAHKADQFTGDLLHWTGIKAMLESIPSAEPERKWIPVSEALPDEYIDVLLQFPHTMAVGYHEDGFWNIITCDDLYSGLDEKDEKPIAWMPLPEAYQGERDGNTI